MGSVKDNGGKREGAGRKSKAEELKVAEIGTNAIIKVYGSLEKYWEHIAKESKESFAHLKLLNEYINGKPRETKDISINAVPTINMDEWK